MPDLEWYLYAKPGTPIQGREFRLGNAVIRSRAFGVIHAAIQSYPQWGIGIWSAQRGIPALSVTWLRIKFYSSLNIVNCSIAYIYIYNHENNVYHHNGFVATHTLGHMMYGWALYYAPYQHWYQQLVLLVPAMCNRTLSDFFPSKSCKKALLQYALVLIGDLDNAFLYIRSLRHPWQSVGECLAFLCCSRLVQESVENIDKTDFLAAKSFFPKDLMFSRILGNLLTNAL